MKKLMFILLLIVGYSCTNQEAKEYSNHPEGHLKYKLPNGTYTTYERYMFDEVFPDTIIVEFTRNGNFEKYAKAFRSGVLQDTLGNYYSPAYKLTSAVGDVWIYDFTGKFIEFGCNKAPHSGSPHTYNP